jgi:hypothetical protein
MLEALFVGNYDFEEIEKSRNVFCPFEAVGMVRQEIRHAHFLAYCFDPQRPHGFGSECLRSLMRAAAVAQRLSNGGGTQGQITPIDVHLMDFEKTQIRREWNGIDLLVIVNEEKLIAAIELKIDAREHSGQLGRYRKIVSEQWPASEGWRHIFIFLTKHGDDVSDDGGDWLALHLTAVAGELDDVVERQVGSPEARSLLASYLAMLRRHHLTDDHLEELAARLWSQHREALDFLVERRPDASDGISGMIYHEQADIAARMSEASGLDIVPDDSSARLMRFAIRSWDDLPDFLTARGWTASNRLMLIEIQRSNDRRHLRMRFVLGPGEQATRLRYYRALENARLPVSSRREITGQWTRLATVRLASDVDDQVDPEAVFEIVKRKIMEYAEKTVPAYDAVLNGLRQSVDDK